MKGYVSSELLGVGGSAEIGGGGGASKLTAGAAARGEEQWPANRQAKTEEAEAAWLKARFRPFPSLLRWPTAPCFACVCCMSGLLQGATIIFVAHKTAPHRAIIVAAIGAAFVLGVLLLLWAQLVGRLRTPPCAPPVGAPKSANHAKRGGRPGTSPRQHAAAARLGVTRQPRESGPPPRKRCFCHAQPTRAPEY